MKSFNNKESQNRLTSEEDLRKGKALLFINGLPPKYLPKSDGYDIIACSDGAFHYLKAKGFPMEKLDFISGDFDSHSGSDEDIYEDKFIHTPDQNKTDFEKALEILLEKNIKTVDIFGASGGEMDHFLGNLTVGFQFRQLMELRFFDDQSIYFFAPNETIMKDVGGRMISLYPFPEAGNIFTDGLNWELHNEDLQQTGRIGTRNFAVKKDVAIKYHSGSLLIFVGGKYR